MSTQTKPEQDQATARPWRVEVGRYANTGQFFIEGNGIDNSYKTHIAQMGRAFDKNGNDQRESNAALIVKAVNEYDVLNAVAEDMNQALTMLEAVVASERTSSQGKG